MQAAARLVERNQFDWEAIGALAAAERIGPLLYEGSRHTDVLPTWLIDQFRAVYLETAAHNLLRLRELSALLTVLSGRGLQVIVLKGMALVERIYGNPALRPMLDVDLLVRRENVGPALDALASVGYRSSKPEMTPGVTLAYENELSLSKPERPDWRLELHWGLFDSPFHQRRIAEESLWDTAELAIFEGAPAHVLSPELMLLHLCGHLVLHHAGRGMLWKADVAEVVYREQKRLDWNIVLARAAALHLVMPLQAVLPATAGDWGAPVPPEVLARLAALSPDAGEMRAFDSLTAGYRPAGRRLLDDLRALPGGRARAAFLYHNLFPSAAYMDERYGIRHRVLRPFYYLYRWVRGLAGLP